MMDLFVNPWLLSGLSLLAAPVIIHLLNKRRFQVVEWAAMDFLFQAEAQNRRRIRFEDLLLLLLRMLLVALVVFAVARPLVRGLGTLTEDERVVVLDDSFSMEAADGGGRVFEAARAHAAREVEEAVARSMSVLLWSGSAPGGAAEGAEEDDAGGAASPDDTFAGGDAVPAAHVHAARVLAELREWEAGDLRLDPAGALGEVGRRAEGEKEPLERALVFVSDFRAADWLEGDGRTLRGELRAALEELSGKGLLDRLRLRLAPVGRGERENAAAVGLRLDADRPVAGVPLRIVVEVANLGSRERRGLRGMLEVGAAEPSGAAAAGGAGDEPGEGGGGAGDPPGGGRSPGGAAFRAVQRLPLPEIDSIAPGAVGTTSIEYTFERPGSYPLLARMEEDGLARDDVAFAVAEVRSGIRALVVDGDPGPGRFDGEAGFLMAALAPRGASTSGIEPRLHRGEITEEALGADVILVLNRDTLAAPERQVLEDFARGGGGLAFFLGSRVLASGYPEGGILPAALGPLRGKDEGGGEAGAAGRVHLEVSDWEHPALAVFRDVEGASLGKVGFDRYYSLLPAAGAAVVARFDDAARTAAIVEMEVAGVPGPGRARAAEGGGSAGGGRVALFNLTADRDWSDWPTDPSYPIVLRRWVEHLAPRRAEARRRLAGEPLVWARAPGVRYEVLPPRGGRHAVDTAIDATFASTSTAGFYCVVAQAAGGRGVGAELPPEALAPAWFPVSRDPRESALAAADPEAVRAALAETGVRCEVHGAGGAGGEEEDASSEGAPLGDGEEGEVWRWCAFAAAAFLLFELFLAWWFGRS
jgi:hypothetical protein